MKRLFSEYEAQIYDDCKPINDIMDKALREIVYYCENNNFSFRDAKNVCVSGIDNHFEYPIFNRAFMMKKEIEGAKKNLEG